MAANQYPHFSDEETESQDIQLRSHSWQAAMMSKLRPFQSKEDFKKKKYHYCNNQVFKSDLKQEGGMLQK